MATIVEPEYESDPEELKRSLAARRREASDDDDDDEDGDGGVRHRRDEIDSEQSDEEVDDTTVKCDDNEENRSEEEEEEEEEDRVDDSKRSSMMKEGEEDVDGGDEEKEKQSSAVPTGGAFYMHDDRFQEMSGGRSRRGRGGRRVWGSGDERKWGHDKYEEINTQEKHYDKRTPRGRFRGRGRGRGEERGYTRGRSSNASSSNGQQIFVPKGVKQEGGPRKNEIPVSKDNQTRYVQKNQLRNSHGSQNSHEKMSHPNSQRSSTAPAKTGNEGGNTNKSVMASSLSSASPPFYPSVSSSDLVHGVQVGMERLHTNESAAPSGKKYRNTKSVFSPVYTAQTFQPTNQGQAAPATGNMFYPQSHSQASRFSSPMQLNGDSKATGQGLDHHSAVSRSLSSTTQKTSSSRNHYPPGEIDFASETGASCDNSNFPAFLPVMQFGGQHEGVPAFGMAYPGYVQSADGVRNPEMTWMPVLTGPGALGASYSPPYAIDGSYQAHTPGLPSSAGSSRKENNSLIDLEKPMERPGVTESWVPKQQKNNPSKQPRRYSEMSFSK